MGYNTPWNLASSIKAHQTKKGGKKWESIDKRQTRGKKGSVEIQRGPLPFKHSQEVREPLEEQFNH